MKGDGTRGCGWMAWKLVATPSTPTPPSSIAAAVAAARNSCAASIEDWFGVGEVDIAVAEDIEEDEERLRWRRWARSRSRLFMSSNALFVGVDVFDSGARST